MRKTVTIGDLGTIITGNTPPRSHPELYGKHTPFIKATDISETEKYTYTPEEYYSEEGYNKYKKSLVPKGSTCVVTIGSIGKKMTMAHCDLFINQAMNAIVPNSNFDNEFVYYAVKNVLPNIKSLDSGTASGRENVSKSAFSRMQVVIDDDIQIQHRIATILSRYDTLIENYQKQIKLLEEAAQRLYKEWFVDLRFPGYEDVKMVDGLPEGWERKTAQDFFTMSIGKTPPRAEKEWFSTNAKDVPWVSISDMKDVMFVNETSEKLTKEACEKFNVRIVPEGTILLSFKLTVGRVSISDIPVCTNEAIAHFVKDGTNWREYTLLYLRNYHYDSLGNTSGISKAVNSTIIKNMPFVMPSAGILDDFSNKISPMFDTIRKLSSQIRLLTEARDRLLPKLMGGEMEVDAPKGQRATSIEQRSGHNEQTTNAPKGQKH